MQINFGSAAFNGRANTSTNTQAAQTNNATSPLFGATPPLRTTLREVTDAFVHVGQRSNSTGN